MARWDDKRGVWRIVIDVSRPGQTGKARRRLSSDIHAPNTRQGRKTAELAEAGLRVAAAAQAEDDWPGGRQPTSFGAVAADWVTRNSGRWSPKTIKETKYALRRYILPHLGTADLEKISPRQIEAMYGLWVLAGRKPPTMRRWHGILSAIFADAERLGDLRGPNPMRRVRPAGGKAQERRVPSPDEVRRVIAAARAPMDRAYFELAAATGARRGTLVALRWRDIDLEASSVAYMEAVAEGCDGQVLKANKAGLAYTVTLTGAALDALRELRHMAIETALALGLSGDMGSLFVFSRDGGVTHWNVSWPTHAWQAACRRAGVTPCRLHDVRHFSATRLLAAGVPTRVVADRLGCTEGNVIRTYSHRVASPEDARAAEVMEQLLYGDAL